MIEKQYVHTKGVLTPSILVITRYEDRILVEKYIRVDNYQCDSSTLNDALRELEKQANQNRV